MATSKSNFGKNADPFNYSEMLKNFKNMPLKGLNREKLLEQHRKNLEALTNASNMAADVVKSISQLQTQFIKEAFEEMATFMREYTHKMKAGNFEKPSKPVSDHVAQWLDQSNKIANMLSQSNRQIYDVFHERIEEGMEEFKKDIAGAKPDTKSRKHH